MPVLCDVERLRRLSAKSRSSKARSGRGWSFAGLAPWGSPEEHVDAGWGSKTHATWAPRARLAAAKVFADRDRPRLYSGSVWPNDDDESGLRVDRRAALKILEAAAAALERRDLAFANKDNWRAARDDDDARACCAVLAHAAQRDLEAVALPFAAKAASRKPERVVLCGGVALNSCLNGKVEAALTNVVAPPPSGLLLEGTARTRFGGRSQTAVSPAGPARAGRRGLRSGLRRRRARGVGHARSGGRLGRLAAVRRRGAVDGRRTRGARGVRRLDRLRGRRRRGVNRDMRRGGRGGRGAGLLVRAAGVSLSAEATPVWADACAVGRRASPSFRTAENRRQTTQVRRPVRVRTARAGPPVHHRAGHESRRRRRDQPRRERPGRLPAARAGEILGRGNLSSVRVPSRGRDYSTPSVLSVKRTHDPAVPDDAANPQAILEEEAAAFFEGGTWGYAPSPYMARVWRLTKEAANLAPACCHADRTARPQTVSKDETSISRYRRLVELVFQKTKCPCVLNTSFNTKPAEPIVESPTGACASFAEAASRGVDSSYRLLLVFPGVLGVPKDCPVNETTGDCDDASSLFPTRRHDRWTLSSSSTSDGASSLKLVLADLDEPDEDGSRTGRGVVPLADDLEAAIYEACDGSASARDIAEALVAENSEDDPVSFRDVYLRMARLWRKTLVTLG